MTLADHQFKSKKQKHEMWRWSLESHQRAVEGPDHWCKCPIWPSRTVPLEENSPTKGHGWRGPRAGSRLTVDCSLAFTMEARGEGLSGHHGRQPSLGLSGVSSGRLDPGASSGAALPKRPDAGIQALWAKRSILVIFGVI